MSELNYSFAAPADLTDLRALLTQCKLSTEGIESALDNCLVARSGSTLVGSAALELHPPFGLLRSLAVSPSHRGRGVGQNLCAKIISHARLRRIECVYLLTIDAAPFFAARGFEHVARDTVPSQLQGTAQFRSLCPASAACMARRVANDVIHASAELLRLRPDVPGARMWAVSLRNTMLTYFEVDPRSRFESHSHESEQITMVLSGELFFELDGVVHRVKAGEVIAIPSLAPHAVWTGELPVTAIDAWSPVMAKY
jgi:amino-acid N-acetyltransferase